MLMSMDECKPKPMPAQLPTFLASLGDQSMLKSVDISDSHTSDYSRYQQNISRALET
jgi:hypothetical protein